MTPLGVPREYSWRACSPFGSSAVFWAPAVGLSARGEDQSSCSGLRGRRHTGGAASRGGAYLFIEPNLTSGPGCTNSQTAAGLYGAASACPSHPGQVSA